MSIKKNLKGLVRRSVQLVARYAELDLRDERNVTIVLAAAFREVGVLSTIRYPAAYADFLRACIERAVHRVTEVKTEMKEYSNTSAAWRFVTLVDELRGGLPAIEFSVAREVALVADENRSRPERLELGEWAGDIGLHFSMSSSFGTKGRILFNVIRLMRSERCLELGTGYGVSALFILSALKAFAQCGHLTTLEGLEPQFSLGSSMLKKRYGEMASCRFGTAGTVLPELVKSLGGIDFMFHDCGHSREDYIRDFHQVIEILVPGAVVLFDDIRWENPRTSGGQARTYEGWRQVIAHPRVGRAVEIDDMLGLLLIR
jgi:predicted O-methyltransferase YrrM